MNTEMKALYIRVSTEEQKTERQKLNTSSFDLIFEEKASGSLPFAEREQGSKLLDMVYAGAISEIHFHDVDRVGRNSMDIQLTISTIIEEGVKVYFDGKEYIQDEDGINELILTVKAWIATQERKKLIRRTQEGVNIAKAKDAIKEQQAQQAESEGDMTKAQEIRETKLYKGRPKGAKSKQQFNYLKYTDIVDCLKAGLTVRKTAEICKVSTGKVQRVSKAMKK